MEDPRVIVVVRGGLVSEVCSSVKLDIDILDYDCDDETKERLQKLSDEADKLIAVY